MTCPLLVICMVILLLVSLFGDERVQVLRDGFAPGSIRSPRSQLSYRRSGQSGARRRAGSVSGSSVGFFASEWVGRGSVPMRVQPGQKLVRRSVAACLCNYHQVMDDPGSSVPLPPGCPAGGRDDFLEGDGLGQD